MARGKVMDLEIHKKQIEFKEGRLNKINDIEYTEIPKDFGKTLEKHMKKGEIWEDIVVVESVEYMPKEKFAVYEELSKTLARKE